jgi:hypothetical protein
VTQYGDQQQQKSAAAEISSSSSEERLQGKIRAKKRKPFS